MRKNLLILICALAMSTWISAQKVIEDFELPQVNQLANDPYTNDSLVIVANPAPNGVDSSTMVLKFRRSMTGDQWAGIWSRLPQPVDLTNMKYISVDILKPRITPLKFKVEGGTSTPTFFELPPVSDQTKTGEWERIVFNFPDATGTYPTIALTPDWTTDPGDLATDTNIFIDNIVLRSAPTGGDSLVLDDFQVIPLHQLSNVFPDDSLKIVPNPLIDDVDSSSMVLKFRRSMTGDPWAGVWSELPVPIDMTDNKYVFVKVLKPRISVVKFKIEGGTTAPTFFELESTAPQTKTDAWEQLVFYFPDATGTYPRIAVEPDFVEGINLDEDLILYIDDIVSSPTAGEATGIIQPEKLNISIYPNPVKSTLYFDNLKDIDRITVSNMVGQQVLINRNITSSRESINVSSLTNGIYMVTLYDRHGNRINKKIIKE